MNAGLLAGCCLLVLTSSIASAQQAAYAVTPEYDGKGIASAFLVVAPFKGLVVKNPDDVTDDLGPGDPVQVFTTYLQVNLPLRLREHSSFRDVRYSTYRVAPVLREQTLRVGRKWIFWETRVNIALPVADSVPVFGSLQPDFVLFLQDFTAARSSEASGAEDQVTVLRLTATFAIWDLKQSRLVAYGRVESYDTVQFRMREETWGKALDELARELMGHTPFRN